VPFIEVRHAHVERVMGRGLGRQGLPFFRGRVVLAAAAATFAYAASSERAQPQGFLDTIPGDWTVTIGVQGKVLPAFEGAKQYEIEPVPVFSLRRSGTAARFSSPFDSASISLIDVGGFHFGPAVKFKRGRDEGDYPAELRGLGDVDFTIEAGVFAEYWPSNWLRTRVEVRRGFGGHEGFVADFSADLVHSFDERWTWSGGPRLSLADNEALAPYFGISPTQSALSGLPAFDAKGGLHSVGAGTQVRYRWTPQWEVRGYVEYSRLLGDAASSPLVTERGSPDQFTFALGVGYSFDIKLW
jgi:outer membrane protein